MSDPLNETYDDANLSAAKRGASFIDYLVVALECDRPLAGASRYSLEGVDRVRIGRGDVRRAMRSTENGVTTLDMQVPGRSMSSAHARLVRVSDTWAIADAGSRNGTFVNGVRVEHEVLKEGDVVELGHTLFCVFPGVMTPDDAVPDFASSAATGAPNETLEPTLAARMNTLARLAPSPVPVLILGESGVGKEVLARWLHAQTKRTGDFIAVNCGAIPTTLVEGQLFGHMKGAFSGALRDELGFVRAADGGTLFLDEVGDLPKASQAALLRVIQEREVVPVGATHPTRVDVRLLAATHAPLADMVDRGEFRRDLYARIAGASVTIPPIRERKLDLGMLIAVLLGRLAGAGAPRLALSADAGRALLRYDWPLNTRELEQCLATCVALVGPDGLIGREHLPDAVAAALDPGVVEEVASSGGVGSSDRDDQLRIELLAALTTHRGNLAHVGRAMGKARTQVQRWCRRFGIDPNTYRS